MSLRRNFKWTLAGNATAAFASFALLSVIAKLGDKHMLGEYCLGVTITALASSLPELSLRAVQATDAKHTYQFGHYLALRLIGMTVAFSIVVGVATLGGYSAATSVIIIAVALTQAANSCSDVIYGLLQQHEQMDRIAISTIVKSCLTVAALALGLALSGRLLVGVLCATCSATVVMLAYDVRSARRLLSSGSTGRPSGGEVLRPIWEPARLYSLAQLSFPLGLTVLLVVLNSHAARLVIVRYLTESALGVYGAIAQLTMAGQLVMTALSYSTSPRLARHAAVREWQQFVRLLLVLLAISAVLGLFALAVGLAAGRTILTLVYSRELAAHTDLFVWLLASSIVMYLSMCFGIALTSLRSFRSQLGVGVVSSVASLAIAFYLIPRVGLVGAGVAAFTMAVVRLVGLGVSFAVVYARGLRSYPTDPSLLVGDPGDGTSPGGLIG